MPKKVLITGITGQDGSYMAEHCLKAGHKVYGAYRRTVNPDFQHVKHLMGNPDFELINLDLTDAHSISGAVGDVLPDYFINFAANSFVGDSWKVPVNHMETNCMGVLHSLEAIRQKQPQCRFYNAGSSEEFGDVSYSPQDEAHPLRPRSPYGASKASARHVVKVYRESYDLYAVQGWLFNHESERRGQEFVTQKIAREAARIAKEIEAGNFNFKPLELGNVDARRDWGHAEDFVEGIWRMMNQEEYNSDLGLFLSEEVRDIDYQKALCMNLKDYVVSSGETHSVRDFVEASFATLGIKGTWAGKGLDETFVTFNEQDTESNLLLVKVNPEFYRPNEVEALQGNSFMIERDLGWSPKTDFNELVRRMVLRQYNYNV